MNQNMTMHYFGNNTKASGHHLSVALMVLAALLLMTTAGFADVGDNPSNAISAVRAEANPGMNVALWYTDGHTNIVSNASLAVRAEANPGMNVALWYADGQASTASNVNSTIRAEANPGMNVALWYAEPSAGVQDRGCEVAALSCP